MNIAMGQTMLVIQWAKKADIYMVHMHIYPYRKK